MARLSLYYPVKPFKVNQAFGANLPCVKNFGLPNQIIVTGVDNTTCPPGFEKLYGDFGMSGHNGIDLQAGEQNIYASTCGVVIEKQIVPARGLGLGIVTDEAVDIDENGTYYMKIRYWHLKSFTVDVGDHVDVGQFIGISDNTGYSSGNHVHFEGIPMVKDSGGHFENATVTGSIAGAINLEPYFNGQYAEGEHVPPVPAFNHTFLTDLRFTNRSEEVVALQRALQVDGEFPTSTALSGYFGYITVAAVKAFQLKYNIKPVFGFVGPLTRAKLNSLFSRPGFGGDVTPPVFDVNEG